MFQNFSLYPGGAFMLCESVGEFDENVPLPVPEEAPAEVMKPLLSSTEDPMIKVSVDLSPVYSRTVVPMLAMDQTGEMTDVEGTLHKLETISVGASDIANSLRKTIGKLSGMYRVFMCSGEKYEIESFVNHIGFFMKNAQTVKRQGVETTEFTYETLPIFQRMWKVNNLISALCNTPSVLDDIIYSPTMDALVAGDTDRTFDMFESTIDMIRCIYDSPERLARLQTKVTVKIEFDDLIKSRAWADETDCMQADFDKMFRQYMCLLSKNLREISQSCYDMQCRFTEGRLESNEFSVTVRKLLSRCINLFAVGTMVAMFYASELRAIVAKKQAVDSYTDLLLNILKTV